MSSLTLLALVGSNGTLSLDRIYEEDSNGVLKAQTRLEKDSAKVSAILKSEQNIDQKPEKFRIVRLRVEVVEEVARESLLKTPQKTTKATVTAEGSTVGLESEPDHPELAESQAENSGGRAQ